MIRALVDTNVLLRMAAGGRRSRLARLWSENRFELVMSLATLTELRDVLSRPAIWRYVDRAKGMQFLALVEQRATFVQPDLSAPACRDPKDTALIAAAVGGRVDFLITADPDILDDAVLVANLAGRGIRVLTSGAFLSHLAESSR